jgi:hypothetical protein
MLRTYFLHHRELLGALARAAWETVLEGVFRFFSAVRVFGTWVRAHVMAEGLSFRMVSPFGGIADLVV